MSLINTHTVTHTHTHNVVFIFLSSVCSTIRWQYVYCFLSLSVLFVMLNYSVKEVTVRAEKRSVFNQGQAKGGPQDYCIDPIRSVSQRMAFRQSWDELERVSWEHLYSVHRLVSSLQEFSASKTNFQMYVYGRHNNKKKTNKLQEDCSINLAHCSRSLRVHIY